MNLLHSFASAFHSSQSLSVDIRCLDGIDLLLQSCYLCRRLLEGMFMLLLASKSRLCRCHRTSAISVWHICSGFDIRRIIFMIMIKAPQRSGRHVPFLLVLTFFRAIASCSSIWFCRCLSLFCSISSCDLKPRIAFLGVSFLFWALCPPNHPQTPDILDYGTADR